MGGKARAKRSTVEDTTTFLNVDLDLESPVDLEPLVRALGPVHVLHQTTEAPFVAYLETEEVGLDCEATISALLDLVDALDEQAERHWDRCTARRFNIGIQSGLEPGMAIYELPAPLVHRIAAAGAEVVVTVYGAQLRTFASGR